MSSTPKVIKITTKPVTTTIKDSVKISWKLDYPYGIAVGEAGIFSAKGTADPRGGDIGLVWDFGDHTTSSGPIVNHIFTTSGIYSVSVLATSTAGTSGEKNFKVYVGEEFAYSASSVKIGNFLVDGDDIDEQFIELINWSNQVKNISGWKIKNNHGKEFEIPENTMMPPSSSRKFFRSITHLGFDKDNDRIIFSTPSDKVVDNVLLDTDKPVMEKIETSKPKTVFNWRRIKGIVSVAPGVFAQQYFYVFDGEHGYQIYQYKKDFPPLQTGDEIAVSGEAIKTDNIERLKISGRKDIDILSTGQEIVPIEISLAELDDDLNGAIVKITGDITSLKNNLLYLDDGNDEIVVYFRPTVKIEKTDLRVGDKLEVIGVLEKSKNDWRISPRSQGDLRLVSDGSESLSGGKGDEADQKNSTTKKYVSVTAGGLFSLLFGLAVKNRGLMLVSVSRKIASTVVKIIRRG